MPTKLARAAVVAMAFGVVAPGPAFKTASVAAAGVGATPTVATPIEQESIRNILQQILQGVRDQIRRKIIGESPKPEPTKSEPGK